MKELKFRAWDGKKIIDDVIPVSETAIVELFEYEWQETEVKAVEQYTGLKDKNGKEIYEGDIVDDGFSRICEIRWSEHSTEFEAINENDGYVTSIWFVAKYGEVIGNIHENPDLLEEKK